MARRVTPSNCGYDTVEISQGWLRVSVGLLCRNEIVCRSGGTPSEASSCARVEAFRRAYTVPSEIKSQHTYA